MSKQTFILTAKGGLLVKDKNFVEFANSFQDGKYLIEKSGADKRSNPQNRYYWGLVVPMIQKGIEDLGTELTKDETHEFLKARFNYSEIVNQSTGEMIQVPISTTRLNKGDFSEYVSKIQQFAAEFLSMVIPDPGTQTVLSYE